MQPLSPSLFPRRVLSAQAPVSQDIAEALASLHPAERELIASAVESRQLEFATARSLARDLLAELGCEQAPLLADPKRAPLWPDSAVGSITHSKLWCAVAVAPSEQIASLGIDIEAQLELDQNLWTQVLTPRERHRLAALSESRAACEAMMIFCAKEALYKAQYPLTHSWLGFEQAEIELCDDGTFEIELLDPVVRTALEAFTLVGGVEVTDRITTAVTISL